MKVLHLLLSLLLFSCSQAQDSPTAQASLLGGPCEGCEAVFEYGDQQLSASDTLADFGKGEQAIKLTGTIYQADGKSPAESVILYIWHTNQKGIYPAHEGATGWAKRHGYLRGWVKTDKDGRFTFYTQKPGSYPSRNAPAHIHAVVLEPNGHYYYLQDFHFSGDPLLSRQAAKPVNPRGGYSGVLDLKKEGMLWVGQQDIILGKNIPNYPEL